jgi:hypothetical protein
MATAGWAVHHSAVRIAGQLRSEKRISSFECLARRPTISDAPGEDKMAQDENQTTIVTSSLQTSNQHVNGLAAPADAAGPGGIEKWRKESTEALEAAANPAKWRVGQDFSAEFESVKAPAIIFGKPDDQDAFRVNPDPGYRMSVVAIKIKATGDIQVLHPALEGKVTQAQRYTLFTWVNRTNKYGIYAIPEPGDGFVSIYTRTARAIFGKAMTCWVQMTNGGRKEGWHAEAVKAELGDPVWELSFDEIFSQALKGHLIEDYDDPILRRLRNEI